MKQQKPINQEQVDLDDTVPEPVADLFALKTWIINNYGPINDLDLTNKIGPVEIIISMFEEMRNNREAWREAYHDLFRKPTIPAKVMILPPSHLHWEREEKQ